MAVHHGGKVGKAGKTLASKNSSKSAKSAAGKTLNNDLMGYIREITLGLLEQGAFGMHGCEITEIK